MERFLSNNQDLQSIDFLNFDSNRIFFRKPKVNKAKSTRLDFDVNLDHIKFNTEQSTLQFGVSLRKNLLVNVYFFRKIEKNNEFGVYEYKGETSKKNSKISSIFQKFGFCFRPDIGKQIKNNKKKGGNDENVQESKPNLFSEILTFEEKSIKNMKESRSIENLKLLTNEKKVDLKNEEKILECKSDFGCVNKKELLSESNLSSDSNFDFSIKYSKLITPSESNSRKLLQLKIPPVFFTKLLKFTKSPSYCPFVLELVSHSSKSSSPKSRLYVLFEEKQGKLVPLMKLFKSSQNRVFILENIYDLSHDKNDSVFDGSPISLKRASYYENNPNSMNLMSSNKKKKLKRKKTHVRPFCSICISTRVTTILLPCRHLCICYDCSKNLITQTNKCPICRNKIGNLVRVYDR